MNSLPPPSRWIASRVTAQRRRSIRARKFLRYFAENTVEEIGRQ
jgi:hypothetical protein